MIVVVGATGDLGNTIVRELSGGSHGVRALVRQQSAHDAFAAMGVEVVRGDLKDTESLHKACRGMEAVVTTANATARGGEDTIQSVDRAGTQNLINAAAAEGVRRFVYVSALGADPQADMPLLQAKGEAEEQLRHSGMAWTVLQPNLFLDKLPMAVVGGPALAGQPVTLIGEGRRRHSMVAMCDVAAFVVAALERSGAEGETLIVGGPQPISWQDVVGAFEQELGRPIPVHTVPLGDPAPGMPDFMTELLSALETYDSPIDSSALADSYGVTQTSLDAFVRGVVADTSRV